MFQVYNFTIHHLVFVLTTQSLVSYCHVFDPFYPLHPNLTFLSLVFAIPLPVSMSLLVLFAHLLFSNLCSTYELNHMVLILLHMS